MNFISKRWSAIGQVRNGKIAFAICLFLFFGMFLNADDALTIFLSFVPLVVVLFIFVQSFRVELENNGPKP